MMKLRVDPACHAAMCAHAEQTYPEECCGSMLGRDLPNGDREVVAVIEGTNSKEGNRERRFLLSPEEQLAAEKTAQSQGLDVVGIYHSHPDHPSQASEFDRQHALPYWSYLIISCLSGKTASVQSFRLADDRSVFFEETLT